MYEKHNGIAAQQATKYHQRTMLSCWCRVWCGVQN